ncbi:MAG: nicotinate-nucleotide adenylyltransferase [Pseudomonadota bacterium]
MSALQPGGAGPTRIGVLGGTFDPIHVGHLRPSLDVCRALTLDEVRFVPCHLTPHRPQPERPSAVRADMVALAVGEVPEFVLDDRELRRDVPSYTVDTLSAMRAEWPDAELYFLLGVDSLNGLNRWHRWTELLELAHLALMRRPGHALNAFASGLLAEHGLAASDARGRPAGGIVTVDTTALDVSSTALRTLLAAGHDPKYLVPDGVREFLLNRTDYVE